MSEKKFYYKYESVFDHNITEAEWEQLHTGFDYVNRNLYLRYVITRPTKGYLDIRYLYGKIRKDPKTAEKYVCDFEDDFIDETF